MLTEIAVTAAPRDAAATSPSKSRFASAMADFAQDGFPPEHAFDGDDKTGWAIHGPEPWNVTRTADVSIRPARVGAPARRAGRSASIRNTAGITRWDVFAFGWASRSTTIGPKPCAGRTISMRKFNDWLTAETARAVRWTLLKPTVGQEQCADADDSRRRFDPGQRRSDQARRLST